jgi:hypothetical protein
MPWNFGSPDLFRISILGVRICFVKDFEIIMPKGFFITGTDTGVGKTVIVASLIKATEILGFTVCGMKPIETGCSKQEFKVKGQKLKVKTMALFSKNLR